MQMNVASSPFGTTTSSHMTANVTNHAMVPIVMYLITEEGEPIIKLGWIVLSDDLKHDYHQVSRWQVMRWTGEQVAGGQVAGDEVAKRSDGRWPGSRCSVGKVNSSGVQVRHVVRWQVARWQVVRWRGE